MQADYEVMLKDVDGGRSVWVGGLPAFKEGKLLEKTQRLGFADRFGPVLDA